MMRLLRNRRTVNLSQSGAEGEERELTALFSDE